MRNLAKGLGALLTGLALTAPVLAQQQGNKTFQCWTDDKGQRVCGDRVPPEAAARDREVIRDGRVVETKKIKTPEELAEEQRKKREAEEAQRRADYDRALLETYRSAKDIEAMRDERLLLIDGRITSTEKNAAGTDKSLEDLRARAAALEAQGKKVDARLANQIKEYEKSQKQNRRALERYRAERNDVETKFNKDLARYYELRGGPPPAPATAPSAPASEAGPAVPAAPAEAPAPEAAKTPGG